MRVRKALAHRTPFECGPPLGARRGYRALRATEGTRHTEECITSSCILLYCCLFFYKQILLNLISPLPPPSTEVGRGAEGIPGELVWPGRGLGR